MSARYQKMDGLNEITNFDQNKFRELVTRAVIRRNLPFMFVRFEEVHELHSYLNNATYFQKYSTIGCHETL